MISLHHENADLRLTLKGRSDPVCDRELVEKSTYIPTEKNVEQVITIQIRYSVHSQSAQDSVHCPFL